MTESEQPLLRYTGHPFVDVGVATITAFVNKKRPEDVDATDLETVVAYIKENYVKPPLRGYLTMAFTSNAWFIQDAYNPDKPGLSPEKVAERKKAREDFADRHLRQWEHGVSLSKTQQCVFTGLSAIQTTLSNKLTESRAGRAQVPLLQGDEAINFFTYGSPGLPICGFAVLALQAFPLGCAKCGVGLLAVHSDNDRLTFEITRLFWQQNQSNVLKAQAAGENSLPSAHRSVKTLLIETLQDIERRRLKEERLERPSSLTAYNFNNGKTPSLVLYHLPLEIMDFLRTVPTQDICSKAWDKLVQRNWEQVKPAKGKGKKKSSSDPPKPRRNYLYEYLFDLPDNAARFMRRFFLPRRVRLDDIDSAMEFFSVPWELIALFIRKVVLMDQKRINRICELGDGLAEYVRSQGGYGKRFFRQLSKERKPSQIRALLMKANEDVIKDGKPPLFDMYGYIEVFEEGFEVMYADWLLARDLVLMRMIDQLKDTWLPGNLDALPEDTEAEAEAEAEGSQHATVES